MRKYNLIKKSISCITIIMLIFSIFNSLYIITGKAIDENNENNLLNENNTNSTKNETTNQNETDNILPNQQTNNTGSNSTQEGSDDDTNSTIHFNESNETENLPENDNETIDDDFQMENFEDISLETNINDIVSNNIYSSPLELSANGDSNLDSVKLMYRYSSDNVNWIHQENKKIGEIRKINDVNDEWTKINFWNTYVSPVIVSTYNLKASSDNEAVVRISNVTSINCDIKIQNPGDSNEVTAGDIYLVIIEEGVHELEDGTKIEAHRYYESSTSSKSSWVTGTKQNYHHTYQKPIVLGQVMSANNSEWSAFWCSNGQRSSPPSSSDLYTCKHVGEDTNTDRNEELIGYIVIESGSGSINGIDFQAGLGQDSICGVKNDPPYKYALDDSYSFGISTLNAMGGSDGGWCVLFGANPISEDLNIAIDEDTISDSDRKHTTEQVSYLVFSKKGNITSNQKTSFKEWGKPGQNPDENAPWAWDFDFPEGIGYYEFFSLGMHNSNVEEEPENADVKCRYLLDSYVKDIKPYKQKSPVKKISIESLSSFDDISLYYRYSNDNLTWSSDETWWDSSFLKRRAVNIRSTSKDISENHPISLNITYDEDMQSDFDDLRFVDYDSNNQLDYWIENKKDGSWCNVWVKIKSEITTFDNTILWIYYGNENVESESDGEDTFLFFDDFNSIDLDSKWQNDASNYSINDSVIRINKGAVTLSSELPINLNDGYVLEGKIMYHNIVSKYSGTLSAQSSKYTKGSNSGSDATSLYMRQTNSQKVYRWTGTGLQNGYDCGSSDVFTSEDETWYILGSEFSSSGVNLTKNRIQTGSYGCGWNKNLSYLSIGAFHGSSSYDIQDTSYDWIILRRHIPSEPIVNIGEEKTKDNGWKKWNSPTNPDTSSPWQFDFDFLESSGYYEFYSIGTKDNNMEETPIDADAKCSYMLDSAVTSINPYNQTSEKINISAFPSFSYNNVTLFYRFSDDNKT